ncbi:MAG: hypothetical protein KAR39_10885 [Thermoplasmata archaeon]|nr:hypothetical protein [Thermoplasmata archaeon]
MPIMVDFAIAMKAKKLGVKMYDADGNGRIDDADLQVILGKEVPGVHADLGSFKAKAQFKLIEAKATKAGSYRGRSLAWGDGGRSLLLQDRLLCEGKSMAEAKQIVKINYFNQLQYKVK